MKRADDRTTPKLAKKRSWGHNHPKTGKEGEYLNNCPHLLSLNWLVKNILENPGRAGKLANQMSAENQEQAAAAEKQREKNISKQA
jgi:hypothetical protein